MCGIVEVRPSPRAWGKQNFPSRATREDFLEVVTLGWSTDFLGGEETVSLAAMLAVLRLQVLGAGGEG